MIMATLEDLKKKQQISRADIGELLTSIGAPGEKQDEKIEAVKSLNRSNRQGHGVYETLESYAEF